MAVSSEGDDGLSRPKTKSRGGPRHSKCVGACFGFGFVLCGRRRQLAKVDPALSGQGARDAVARAWRVREGGRGKALHPLVHVHEGEVEHAVEQVAQHELGDARSGRQQQPPVLDE